MSLYFASKEHMEQVTSNIKEDKNFFGFGGGKSETDLEKKIAEDRFSANIIDVRGGIDSELADSFVNKLDLMYKKHLEKKTIETMHVRINIDSPGGSVAALLRILDAMKRTPAIYETFCENQASSAAAVLLMCGTKNYRTATATATIMIHGMSVRLNTYQTIDELENQVKQSRIVSNKLHVIMADAMGYDVLDMADWIKTNGDHFMSPDKAMKFRIIDRIAYPAKSRMAPICRPADAMELLYNQTITPYQLSKNVVEGGLSVNKLREAGFPVDLLIDEKTIEDTEAIRNDKLTDLEVYREYQNKCNELSQNVMDKLNSMNKQSETEESDETESE